MILLLGDFNARVGTDHEHWKGVIGDFGLPSCNRNGLKLLEFCTFNSLTITGTVFQT